MSGQEEFQEAVFDLHQYLSDHVAPLMVADSIALLVRYPPEVMAEQVQAWIGSQALSAPPSDYLFHAAKKVATMGQFELVPREALVKYLKALSQALLQYCPEADRDVLAESLQRLSVAPSAAAPVASGMIHRQAGPQLPPSSEPGLTREVRRLSLLLEHLRPLAAAAPERRSDLASQFMAEAAVQSTSARDLDDKLAPLGALGIDTATEHVLRTLARSLPGWALASPEGAPLPGIARDQVAAMQKVVAVAEDPAEAARRFRELVAAAIEQFNEGSLGKAVTIFELATELATQQKVKASYVDPLRKQAHERLDAERLRKLAERPDVRAQLRPVLAFCTALQPAGLLDALDGETRRDRRHQLLSLLEVHGGESRAAAWERLSASVAEGAQVDPFFQMNLVYLLRIIPRPPEVSLEAEIGVVMAAAGRSSPPPLVKQVIAYLAATRHEKTERALITYLKVFESMLLQPETAVYPPAEVEGLLDRTCAALARYGSNRSSRLLIDHGLKVETRLGSTFARLAEAGRMDLSPSRDLVERLVSALRAELPRGGVLGFAGRKNDDKIGCLVQALAGTPLPEVREVLQDVATRFPDRPFGDSAQKALAALSQVGKPPPPPAGLSGDLDLFGLPNLLQTIAQSKFSGVLTLLSTEGATQSTLLFDSGQFRGGQFGIVLGEEAIYQLLERPFGGTFAFVSRADVASQPRVGPPQEVFPLLMEGVRRHDEFKQAAGVVADAARLVLASGTRTNPDDEDPDFAHLVWTQVASGKSAQDCETAISTDSYRVRRLLARWVEEGALRDAAQPT